MAINRVASILFLVWLVLSNVDAEGTEDSGDEFDGSGDLDFSDVASGQDEGSGDAGSGGEGSGEDGSGSEGSGVEDGSGEAGSGEVSLTTTEIPLLFSMIFETGDVDVDETEFENSLLVALTEAGFPVETITKVFFEREEESGLILIIEVNSPTAVDQGTTLVENGDIEVNGYAAHSLGSEDDGIQVEASTSNTILIIAVVSGIVAALSAIFLYTYIKKRSVHASVNRSGGFYNVEQTPDDGRKSQRIQIPYMNVRVVASVYSRQNIFENAVC